MADNFVQRVQGITIGSEYQLTELLGSGSFGKVYLGRNISNLDQVAIKLEHHSVLPSLLEEEAQVYESLADQQGFPRIYWHGNKDEYQCLVMELLGPNLEDLLQYCGGHFSLKTTSMLADQLLLRFESLHSTGYLHRDVKPENFLLGRGSNGNLVYMTDLGLATFRLPERDNAASDERLPREPHLLGTCRYASIQGHIGTKLSPRDDLEALGYMLVYFMKGKLPWQGIQADNEEARYLRVLQMKQATNAEDLCSGLPMTFTTYMRYVRGLRSTDTPDYSHLRGLFMALTTLQQFVADQVFDWTVLEFERRPRVKEDHAPKAQRRSREGRPNRAQVDKTPQEKAHKRRKEAGYSC